MLRVAVADQVDPQDITLGSGCSASILEAMQGVVADAIPLMVAASPRVSRVAYMGSLLVRMRPSDMRNVRGGIHRARNSALLGRPTLALRSWAARRRLSELGELDGIVQRGCEMRLPRSARIVTHEDSTLRQALRAYPWPHLHGLTAHDIERYATRQQTIYRSVVACCGATHWVKDSIVADYGIRPERVHVVGLGANHVIEAPKDRDWSKPRFLFIGADWERKNGPAVLAAFARVRECHPNALLDVVGGHPRIGQSGVTAHGHLSMADAADRSRVAELYRASTAYVMPSLHEPAGTVYVEAAGAGLASIGTTNGGARTVIGAGGILVDPLDGDEIASAMIKLSEPQTAARLGGLAREHANLNTWRKVAERLVRALDIPGVDTTGLAEFL